MFGAGAAAWPAIRHDLHLTYAVIGLILALPEVLAAAVEPVLGLVAGAGYRRYVVVGGGIAYAAALFTVASSTSAWVLLAGFALFYPASGAFVALSQAAMIDLNPEQGERTMALWTLAGSIGVSLGPLLLAGAVLVGAGWRGTYLILSIATVPLTVLAWHHASAPKVEIGIRQGLRGARRALGSGRVLRWLAMLEAGNAMGDVLNGYLALYAVDVARASVAQAGIAVFALTVSGLAGDALLLPLLRRMRGRTYLRLSAGAMMVVYPVFLLVPGTLPKLVPLVLVGILRAGWYALPQAGLYAEIPQSSSSMLILSNAGSLASAVLLFGFGLLAQRVGTGVAMWLLLIGPLALLVLCGTVREDRPE